MSWTDFYRRQEILGATVRLAARNPGEPLPLEEVPGAEEHFGTEENVLTALQYQWTRTLSGRLRSEVVDPDDADGLGDHVDAVTRAWRAAVDEHADLRAVLDGAYGRHASLRRMHEGELRMLAVTAGLADPREPAGEIVKVGYALEALLRANREERRRPVLGHLRRLLAPSA
ncbi:hypothetical protein [Amycolatopsis sp. CA-128772]|uniref:hypothetical protein n=1 Tax=Amycolatopsis sp. CA-128772 TaxID=2073159 RepID=UPI000CD18F02|nr:hypothetical protein [Amycolatopsis sp. CA-128772]